MGGIISETAYRNKAKLIGQSLPIREHGIGYSNFAFAANKGQKRPTFSFKPMKCLEGLQTQSQSSNGKEFLMNLKS